MSRCPGYVFVPGFIRLPVAGHIFLTPPDNHHLSPFDGTESSFLSGLGAAALLGQPPLTSFVTHVNPLLSIQRNPVRISPAGPLSPFLPSISYHRKTYAIKCGFSAIYCGFGAVLEQFWCGFYKMYPGFRTVGG